MLHSTLGDQHTWKLERSRRLLGRRPFDYVSIEATRENIVIAAQAEFQFSSDSAKPVVQEEPPADTVPSE